MSPKQSVELGRFTDVAFLILLSLANGPKHGYVIIEDIKAFSGVQFEPGTLYGALLRLENKGWIEALEAQERRHPYRITPTGQEAFSHQFNTLEQLVNVGKQRLALN